MKKKRDYKREVALQTKQDIIRRAMRNKARRMMLRRLSEKHGKRAAEMIMKGKDVGHIKALKSGGENIASNTKLQSVNDNRSEKDMVKNPGRGKNKPKKRH